MVISNQFARWRDWYCDTSKTCLGGGMHCPSASSTCNACVNSFLTDWALRNPEVYNVCHIDRVASTCCYVPAVVMFIDFYSLQQHCWLRGSVVQKDTRWKIHVVFLCSENVLMTVLDRHAARDLLESCGWWRCWILIEKNDKRNKQLAILKSSRWEINIESRLSRFREYSALWLSGYTW